MTAAPPITPLAPALPPLSRREIVQWLFVIGALGVTFCVLAFLSADRNLVRRRFTLSSPSGLVAAAVEDVAAPNRHTVVTRVLLLDAAEHGQSASAGRLCVLEVSFRPQAAWRDQPVPVHLRWSGPTTLVVQYDHRAQVTTKRLQWRSVLVTFEPLVQTHIGA